jgi:hypothetical protein
MNIAFQDLPVVKTDKVDSQGHVRRLSSLQPLPKPTPEVLHRKVWQLKEQLKTSQQESKENLALIEDLLSQLQLAKKEARSVSELKAQLERSQQENAQFMGAFTELQHQFTSYMEEYPRANEERGVPIVDSSDVVTAWLDGL